MIIYFTEKGTDKPLVMPIIEPKTGIVTVEMLLSKNLVVKMTRDEAARLAAMLESADIEIHERLKERRANETDTNSASELDSFAD